MAYPFLFKPLNFSLIWSADPWRGLADLMNGGRGLSTCSSAHGVRKQLALPPTYRKHHKRRVNLLWCLSHTMKAALQYNQFTELMINLAVVIRAYCFYVSCRLGIRSSSAQLHRKGFISEEYLAGSLALW